MTEAERLTQDLFAAFARRDLAAAAAMIADDAVWRFPGRRGALAGDHNGRDAIFDFLTKVAGLTEGSFHAAAAEIVGNDKVAFFHFIGHARRGGKTLENDTCLRLEFAGGRLVAAQEWVWDLDHVEKFWN
jgi:ketosteroid isomerase-like protein